MVSKDGWIHAVQTIRNELHLRQRRMHEQQEKLQKALEDAGLADYIEPLVLYSQVKRYWKRRAVSHEFQATFIWC